MDRINEVTRMSREQMTSKVGQRYWGLYASFYEKLFQKIDLVPDLKDAYNSRMKSGELTGEAKDAMTFFYRIRRDELDDPKFWNSVRENNVNYVAESLNEWNEISNT